MTHADHAADHGHYCCATKEAKLPVTDPVCGMTVDPAKTAYHVSPTATSIISSVFG